MNLLKTIGISLGLLKTEKAKREEKLFSCEAFVIYDGDNIIATLDNPIYDDMFWVYFDIHPTSSDPAILDRLYSEDFWLSKDIAFYTKEGAIACSFIPPLHIPEEDPSNDDEEIDACLGWGDEDGNVITLKDKPHRLLLRGPYPIEGEK